MAIDQGQESLLFPIYGRVRLGAARHPRQRDNRYGRYGEGQQRYEERAS